MHISATRFFVGESSPRDAHVIPSKEIRDAVKSPTSEINGGLTSDLLPENASCSPTRVRMRNPDITVMIPQSIANSTRLFFDILLIMKIFHI